jgi:Arc/MetJ-type ribon-helix-helix transcriptional regulator
MPKTASPITTSSASVTRLGDITIPSYRGGKYNATMAEERASEVKVKAMTLRLPADQAAELEAVARADDKSVSETVREAIDALIDERRRDKEFRARIRAIIEEDRELLERLAR